MKQKTNKLNEISPARFHRIARKNRLTAKEGKIQKNRWGCFE